MRRDIKNSEDANAAGYRERVVATAVYSLPASLAPALLSEEMAASFLGVSVRKFAALRHEPWMPPAIVLGPRLIKFARHEIEAAIALMPRQERPGDEPAALANSRAERAKRVGGAA